MPALPEACDALVLGADEHTGLAAVRSLHREGVRVLGGGLDARGYGFRSRALRAHFVYPNPEKDRAGFVQCVREAALRHRVRAILPSLDTALIALHEARRDFEGVAALGIAPFAALEAIRDKGRLRVLADSLGIGMPRSFVVGDDPESLPSDFPLPAVVKQRESGRLGPSKVMYCGTRQEVLDAIRLYLQSGHAPIVQELAYGYGVQLCALCRGGEIFYVFQYRRVREYSCRGGLYALAVSEPVDPIIRDLAGRLLRALKWEGVAGVECKVPVDRSGRILMLEINARFIGTTDLAQTCGVNFPYLQYQLAVGDEVPSQRMPYRVGVKARRWLFDTLALIELLFDRPAITGVPLPGRARALSGYVEACGLHVGSDLLQLNDPLPGVVGYLSGLPVVVRKLVSTLGSRYRAWARRGRSSGRDEASDR